MPAKPIPGKAAQIATAQNILRALGFGERQSNELAALVLLSLAGIPPRRSWAEASAPLLGITPIIESIARHYGVHYAPNTRETIRDEAVKFFAESALLLRNPDKPDRPTNSGKTVYQLEPHALVLLQSHGTANWAKLLAAYLKARVAIQSELSRQRSLARVPVTLSDGGQMTLSPGGQNLLIKTVIEHFGPIFTPGGLFVYVGDTESKHLHLDAPYLAKLGITLDTAAKMPDLVIHDVKRNWLVLIEAVTSAGPVDGKRRSELKQLFKGSTAGLVFVTAFETRKTMQSFVSQISWESEVWIAEAPDHLIHFNGERFLGPYPDAMPRKP
jgi:BsuBI/PstI restriction endonuclease domain/BsuBI/PstI restriction endonuclease HTH domain